MSLLIPLLLACAPAPRDGRVGQEPPADAGTVDSGDPGGGDGPGDAGGSDTGTGSDGGGTDTDTDTDTDGGADTGSGGDSGGDSGTPTEDPWHVDRIVIAGDSWSTGSVSPTVDLLAARGRSDIDVAYETTALAGSMASEWADNDDGKLDALDAALDGGATGADVLVLYLGGNDYNFALIDGLPWWKSREDAVDDLLDTIEADLSTLIAHARRDRPGLQVVIVGYDYLHFEWMELLYGFDFDADDTLEYNQGLAMLEARKLGLALADPDVHYAHNLGIMQHVLGNPVTLPFTLPLVDYPAGFFDAPSGPPDYAPFPGGVRRSDIDPDAIPPESLPGPATGFDDGVHPSAAGWAAIVDNTWSTVLADVVADRP